MGFYSLGVTWDRLFGRDAECEALVRLVDRLPDAGGALVVRGDPGIGKTALLDVARGRALEHGVSVLSVVGVESESSLAFAGLHQLLLPVLSGLERLPSPQREALSGAFGIATAPVPDLFLVALAALNLLADAAEDASLLLVVEDMQWLDRPTADVLGFVARRVESEPIVLLFALRDGLGSHGEVAALPELRLGPVDEQAARALLEAHHPGLAVGLRGRVMRMAAGNPLALIELPAALGGPRSLNRHQTGGSISLTSRLERAFADQSSRLPADARALLLIAATDERVGHEELVAAASALVGHEITLDALVPAEEAGLARLDHGVPHFRHPLVRSAVYQAAGAAQQRAAHAALADVLADPEREIWHLAAASVGPDEVVARGLEELATRLAGRGAISVAAAAIERAGAVSADSARRCSRLLRAAELAFELGEEDVVRRLVLEAEQLDPDQQQRLRLTWLREIFTDGVPGDAAWIQSLVRGALQAAGSGDTDLALNLLLGAGLRCWWAEPGGEARHGVVAAVQGLRVPDADPRPIATLAVADPVGQADLVLGRLDRVDFDAVTDPQAGQLLGMAAHAVYDCQRAGRLLDRAAAQLRAQGRLGLLVQVLTMRAWDAVALVDFAAARAAADEGRRLALETGQPIWAAGAAVCQAFLLGLRGEVGAAADLLAEAEKTTIPMGLGSIMCVGRLARGVVALVDGRPGDAVEHLQAMFDPTDPSYHVMDRIQGITYLAEAALLSGRRPDALTILGELEPVASRVPSAVLHLGLMYARAILAKDDDAEPVFEAALGSELQQRPFHRARLQLGYGAWLRRRRRIAESRAPLRAARDTFDALGTIAWAERARQELRASGERSRQRVPETRDQLTAQELQIARLAATGLSNPDIAQQLYLSPRTVASHLYRLFPKLGITSRAQLAAALSGELQGQ